VAPASGRLFLGVAPKTSGGQFRFKIADYGDRAPPPIRRDAGWDGPDARSTQLKTRAGVCRASSLAD